MKIPHAFSPAVGPQDQSQKYYSDEAANGFRRGRQAIAAGIEGLSDGFAARAKTQESVERSKLLIAYSDWQEELNHELSTQRDGSPEDDSTYFERADAVIENSQTRFLEKIPPQFISEFEVRSRETANNYRGREFEFDEKKKGVFFRNLSQRELNRAKSDTLANVDNLENNRITYQEKVRTTALPEYEKDILVRDGDAALNKIAYRQYLHQELAGKNVTSATLNSYVDRLIGIESGGKADAKSATSSATGQGQFIEATWLRFISEVHPALYDGEALSLRKDPALSREAVEWYARENAKVLTARGAPITDGTLYLAHFAGADGASKVYGASPETRLDAILSPSAIAANAFLKDKTAGWLVDWAYQKMGRDKAYTDTDQNPLFDNVLYEDRVAIRSDLENELRGERTAMIKSIEDNRKAAVNDLMLGIVDGRFGFKELDEARAKGIVTDVDEVTKAQALLKERKKNIDLFARANQILFDPTYTASYDVEDDKKALDKIGEPLLGRIRQNDPQAMQAIFTLAQQKSIIPENVMDELNAGATSINWARQKYSLDTLVELQRVAPYAFNRQTNKDESEKVNFYNERRNMYPEDQLRELLSPVRGHEAIARHATMAKTAKDFLKEQGTTVEDIFSEFTEYTRFGESVKKMAPPTRDAFFAEYQTRFADIFARYDGDAKFAHKEAVRQMQLPDGWGFSNLGGKNVLMKYPPERVYPSEGGDHSYILDEVVASFNLEPNTSFRLIPDAQTAAEYASGKPASYQVLIFDADGNPQLPLRGPDGGSQRINFAVTPERRALTAAKFEVERKRKLWEAEAFDHQQAELTASEMGFDPPVDLFKAVQGRYAAMLDAQDEYEKLRFGALTPEQREILEMQTVIQKKEELFSARGQFAPEVDGDQVDFFALGKEIESLRKALTAKTKAKFGRPSEGR